jgi:hypothetical protein
MRDLLTAVLAGWLLFSHPATLPVGAESDPPVILSIGPLSMCAHSVLGIYGHGLVASDFRNTEVRLEQANIVLSAKVLGGTGPGDHEELDIEIPGTVTPGEWNLIVSIGGRQSAPARVKIGSWKPPVLRTILPRRGHPGEEVGIWTATGTHTDDEFLIRDATGRTRRIAAGAAVGVASFQVPYDMPDGEMEIRVGRPGETAVSNRVRFQVTDGPLPIEMSAIKEKSLARGEWINLLDDWTKEFELTRSDRAEVEFRQQAATYTAMVMRDYPWEVEVPEALMPGKVRVRSRTWRNGVSSDWSEAVTVLVRR